MESFVQNLALGIFLIFVIGPVTIKVIKTGLEKGLYGALKASAGVMLAETIFFSLVFFGLREILKKPEVSVVLGVLGIAFLVHLSIENLKDFCGLKHTGKARSAGSHPFLAGLMITLFNPLTLFVWMGIVGNQLHSGSVLASSGVLAGKMIALVSISCISAFGRKLMSQGRMRLLSLVVGLFLLFYSLRMLHILMDLFR